MQETIKIAFEKLCKDLQSTFAGKLTWKWDSRFEAILAEFGRDDRDNIRGILDKHLNYVWEKAILKQSPAAVQGIGNQLGGLMTNQLLFTSDPDQGGTIFCAWWPWGDGSTTSIRIAPDYTVFANEEKSQLIEESKSWFGI